MFKITNQVLKEKFSIFFFRPFKINTDKGIQIIIKTISNLKNLKF